MAPFFQKKIVLVSLLIVAVASLFIFSSSRPKIDYSADVKPIFNKNCISCHGGVKQKAGFSLLFREEALGKTESGKPAIIPGKPSESELMRRITATDVEERMPYKHEPLSENEIDILRQWIKEGATWGEHWAYVPVKKETLPDIDNKWIRNDIDRFIFQKLQEVDLSASEEADKPTLLRRVSLDLTGLPPKEEVANKFLNDNSEKAYENLVDELLASKQYGERWTSLWLDLARYADTRGYEADRSRNIWKYRDWLIDAFNEDKPYDVFLTEQLAGDLMPNADDAKYIATSFHRNTMTNDEGGTENEEFRTAAVMDRVSTTWSALMGSTFNCVQCHSHPYDPFKHEEYYKFMAFFNNSRDEDTQSEYPVLRQYKKEDSVKLMEITSWLKQNVSAEAEKKYHHFLKTWQPTINSLQCDQFVNAALLSSWYAGLRNGGSCRLPDVELSNKKQWMFRYNSRFTGGKLFVYLDSLNGTLYTTHLLAPTNEKWKVVAIPVPPAPGRHNLYFKYVNPNLKSPDITGVFFDWFRFDEPFPGKDKPGYTATLRSFEELMHAEVEETPVMIENTQEQFRATHVFERGNWLVKGVEVKPDVPHIMNPFPANAPYNRLGLASWLTDKRNPLTARTMVNRLWEQLFGFGLVETLEDMGTQGIPPTHMELLDHLSWKLMNDFNWSIKKLLKEMVVSATYRQDSKVNPELIKKDPYNKWYARGPRVRLSAEQIRDQALAVSNLLSDKMYGKSVMPFQPEGIWLSPYNGDIWTMSEGADRYRRALYTYWKRTAPYPSMITFDGGAREVCITRRIRTNTPLQALTTLNDSSYLVTARHFAYRMEEKGGSELKQRIQYGYQAMMYKPISANRLNALVELYQVSVKKFKNNAAATCEMVGVMDKNNNPETAALVVVANAMQNLDEVITKN
jgi:mono/diheme cytochrome c family protein